MATKAPGEQLGLDFTSAANERWAALRGLPLPPGSRSALVAYLLETIFGTVKASSDATILRPYPDQSLAVYLAGRLHLPKSSIYAVIDDAVALGLLAVDKTDGAIASIEIIWPALAELRRDPPAKLPPRRQTARRPSEIQKPPRASEIQTPPSEIQTSPSEIQNDTILSLKSPVSPPPPTPSQPPAVHNWQAAAAAVSKFGISCTSEAIRTAKRVGMTPEDVIALVDYANHQAIGRVKAYGPGALYHRIKQAAPGLEPSAGWPRPSEAYAKARAERERARRQIRRPDSPPPKPAAKAASPAIDLDQLEEAHGATLDAMTEDDRRQVAAAAGEFAFAAYRSNPAGPTARDILLTAYANQQKETAPC